MISRAYIEIDAALIEILNDPDTPDMERTEALREQELLRFIKRLEALREALERPREGAPILETERERQGLFMELAHTINILGRKAGIRTLREEAAPLFPRAYARIKKAGCKPTQSEGDVLTYHDVVKQPIRALDTMLKDVIPYSLKAQAIGTGEAWDELLDGIAKTRGYLFLCLVEWSGVLETDQGRAWLRSILTEEVERIEERLTELSESWDELKERGETEGLRDPFVTDPGGGRFGLRGARIP